MWLFGIHRPCNPNRRRGIILVLSLTHTLSLCTFRPAGVSPIYVSLCFCIFSIITASPNTMLRLIYLGAIFKWRGHGSCSTLCCGLKGAKARKDGEEEKKGSWRPDGLRRRLIKKSITPSLMLTSILADIDVAADWYFWVSADFTGTQFEGIEEVALFFAVVGTITWLVLATDALGWLRVYACRNSPLWGTFLLWPLINVFVEDLPQLVITFMTTAFDTVAGTLNIATAAVSLLVKVVEAYGSRTDDLPSDFSLIDHNGSSIVQRRMELDDDVRQQKRTIAKLTPLISEVNESPDLPMSMQKAFKFARDHEDYVDLMDRVRTIKLYTETSAGGELRGIHIGADRSAHVVVPSSA